MMKNKAATSEPIAHIVDDDPVVLESISWLLMSMDIAYRTYANATDFLSRHDSKQPGCVILDVRMPGMSGIELQEFLKTGNVEIPIIFISGHSDVPVAVRAMKHGAIEFLQKPFDQKDLLEAVRKAFSLDREQREKAGASDDLASRMNSLSPREREILRLLVEGQSAKEVGKRLEISPRTVEYHRNNVLQKMNTRSVVSLAALIGRLADE